MGRFAVIDTETTWGDDVMSIGVVIAEAQTFEPVDQRYYVITPYKDHGGMYTEALYVSNIKPHLECSRSKVMADLNRFLSTHRIADMYAYNAAFDQRHLPELRHLSWHDIMKLAAYRQHNHKIPHRAECYSTGQLKRGYGVESIYRMLSDDMGYSEMHNALTDAVDELMIMKMLNHELSTYACTRL